MIFRINQGEAVLVDRIIWSLEDKRKLELVDMIKNRDQNE
jgi:hypothetical protein